MNRDSVLARVATGAAVGGAIGGAVGEILLPVLFLFIGGAIGGAVGRGFYSFHKANHGAVYGTYDAIRYKVPGFLKIRHIGQTTLGSAAVFSLFLAAGTLIRSH